jgi:hypothetical protein
MANTSLTYSKGAKKSFVEGYFNNKFSSTPKPISASEAFVYDVANEQRDFFKPIFANETQYLPNIKGTEKLSDYSDKLDSKSNSKINKSGFPSNESLTLPPHKRNKSDIIKFLIVSAGLFVVYQILTD